LFFCRLRPPERCLTEATQPASAFAQRPARAELKTSLSVLCASVVNFVCVSCSARSARPQYPAGDRPAVDLGGAVVDAEGADVAEEARDDRVVGDAEPAQICMLRSTTRQIASEQMTLAMLDSWVPRSPWSSTQAACARSRGGSGGCPSRCRRA